MLSGMRCNMHANGASKLPAGLFECQQEFPPKRGEEFCPRPFLRQKEDVTIF